jgi:uncharacterized membrane protein YeaQ/YmgE (transglycosylase-associated protein family)
MSLISIIIWLIIGAFVGWLAGLIMKSEGGLLYNIILGIVGSAVGGFVAGQLRIGTGAGLFNTPITLVGLIISVAGACLVVFLVRLIRR